MTSAKCGMLLWLSLSYIRKGEGVCRRIFIARAIGSCAVPMCKKEGGVYTGLHNKAVARFDEFCPRCCLPLSASTCLQHSPNHVQRLFSGFVVGISFPLSTTYRVS